ncbi:Endonuclease/Exonuclease/phosphatase family [Butyrivibrio fibrisolvens 16/4]|nr:Endonuclease/Exonuclease/phosphatase family [Butyrivibrio fibrisolvens 16/4]
MIVRAGINVTSIQPQRRYTIYTVDTNVNKYIVAALHLEDRRNYKTAERIHTIQTIVPDIEKNELCNDSDNTIVIGDFNANPYDEEMLSKFGFNAVLFKSLIINEEYTNPNSNRIRRFYNPILHYLSEETEMYGSFYTEQNYMTSYWHCLDQVLVRRKLANNIAGLQYLKSINNIDLIKGKRPNNDISDHLPLLVNIIEGAYDER